MLVSNANEHDENGQVVFSFDGEMIGLDGDDYIAEIFDGGEIPYDDPAFLPLGTVSQRNTRGLLWWMEEQEDVFIRVCGHLPGLHHC